MVLDVFAQKNEFPGFQLDKKSNALVSEGALNGEKILLAKPQTFMNNSGLTVKSLYTRYKIQNTKYIIIIHDDIDIPLGKIKVSFGRGSAGHKGVESIIKSLGTKNFTRIRVGIQPSTGKPKNVETFVLKNFAPKEVSILKQKIKEAEAITLGCIATTS